MDAAPILPPMLGPGAIGVHPRLLFCVKVLCLKDRHTHRHTGDIPGPVYPEVFPVYSSIGCVLVEPFKNSRLEGTLEVT